ncbi:MAG: Flp family type IVb pilin [Acidimicrobiales bacterium]
MAFKRQTDNRKVSRRHERGANLIEYALLLALIAVVCVGAVSMLGGSTSEPISNFGSQLGE